MAPVPPSCSNIQLQRQRQQQQQMAAASSSNNIQLQQQEQEQPRSLPSSSINIQLQQEEQEQRHSLPSSSYNNIQLQQQEQEPQLPLVVAGNDGLLINSANLNQEGGGYDYSQEEEYRMEELLLGYGFNPRNEQLSFDHWDNIHQQQQQRAEASSLLPSSSYNNIQLQQEEHQQEQQQLTLVVASNDGPLINSANQNQGGGGFHHDYSEEEENWRAKPPLGYRFNPSDEQLLVYLEQQQLMASASSLPSSSSYNNIQLQQQEQQQLPLVVASNNDGLLINSANQNQEQGGFDYNYSEEEENWRAKLPVGYRFKPRDEHLLVYLATKVSGEHITPGIIKDLNVYLHQPQNLHEYAYINDFGKMYFFTPVKRKDCSTKKNERTVLNDGFWKASTARKDVLGKVYNGARMANYTILGHKAAFAYHTYENNRGSSTRTKTKQNWLMQEYRLPDNHQVKVDMEDTVIVLCVIYYYEKSKKKGSSHATFRC